jgi:subtilisin family serine protease
MTYRNSARRNQSPSLLVESLESRELLSGTPWVPGARLIHQDTAAANYPSITGAGEAIVIIDSGVDYNHPALGGAAIGGNSKVVAGYDFESNDPDPMSDRNAHGTGSAGVAAANGYVYKNLYEQGIAPGAKVIALKESTASGVESAMKWTLANRTKYNIVAVNYTFWSGDATVYIDELKSLIANGVFVSRPAGNSGAGVPVGKPVDPADVAVGSVNATTGAISSFSQRGPNLALLAPGENVTLPYYDVSKKTPMYVDTASGTSWSSPAVVGAAALIKQINPAFTPLAILNIMKDSGVPTYDSATKLTYKRLDVNAALALAYARKGGSTTTTTPQAPLSSGPTHVPSTQSPFSGTPISIAADTTIQAENFDNGGEGVAYHDNETSNLGGSTYRSGAGVDVSDVAVGRAVTFTKAGEWMEYTVNVAAAGTYTLSTHVASLNAGGTFHVEVDGTDKTGALRAPDTKAWSTYTNVTKTGVALTAGQHVLRVKMDSNGSLGYVANFDSLHLTGSGATTTTTTPTTTTTTTTGTTASRSAFTTIAAPTYSAMSGLSVQNSALASTGTGDWAAYNGLDFGAGASSVTFNLGVDAASAGRQIQIRTGGAAGAVVGTLTVKSTGAWNKYTAQTATLTTRLTGVQNLYLTFSGGSGVANIVSFMFNA